MPKHSTSAHSTLSFLLALLKTLKSYEADKRVVVKLSDDEIEYDANQQSCKLSSETFILTMGRLIPESVSDTPGLKHLRGHTAKLVDGMQAYGTYLAQYTKEETDENAVFYKALVQHCTHIDREKRPPNFAVLQTYLELHLFVYEKINFIEKFQLHSIHFDRCDSIDSVLTHETELKNQLKQIREAKEWQDYRELRILGRRLTLHAQITQTQAQIDRLFKYIEQEAQCCRSRLDPALPPHPRKTYIPRYTTSMEDKDEESSLEDEEGLRLVPVKQLGKGVYSSARLMRDKDNKKSLVVLSPNTACVGYYSSEILDVDTSQDCKRKLLAHEDSSYVYDNNAIYYFDRDMSKDNSWCPSPKTHSEIFNIFTEQNEDEVLLLTERELSKLNSALQHAPTRSPTDWEEIYQKLYFNQITHSPEQVFFFKIEVPGFPPTYRLGIPYIHDQTVDTAKFETFLSKLKFLKALADRLAFYNNRLVIMDIKQDNMLFFNGTCHFIDGGISREENEPVGSDFSCSSSEVMEDSIANYTYLDPSIWTVNDPPTDPALAQFHWDIYALGSMVHRLRGKEAKDFKDLCANYALFVELELRLKHQDLSQRPKIDAIQTYLRLNIEIYEKLTQLQKLQLVSRLFTGCDTLSSIFDRLTQHTQKLNDMHMHPVWQEYLQQKALGWQVHYLPEILEIDRTNENIFDHISQEAFVCIKERGLVAKFENDNLIFLKTLAVRGKHFAPVNKAISTAILSLVASLIPLFQILHSFDLDYGDIFELYSMLYTFQVAASQAIQKAEKRIGGPSEYTNSLKRELIIVSNDAPAKYSFRLFKPEQEEKSCLEPNETYDYDVTA